VPTAVRCPICRKTVPWHGNPWRPFCSERCKLVDLGNWASESYRIAGETAGADHVATESPSSGNGEPHDHD
jgi:endogenous inhibitor of DNA gyrase (YacG/DUF329 family)